MYKVYQLNETELDQIQQLGGWGFRQVWFLRKFFLSLHQLTHGCRQDA